MDEKELHEDEDEDGLEREWDEDDDGLVMEDEYCPDCGELTEDCTCEDMVRSHDDETEE